VFTDEYISYRGLDKDYVRKVINHAERYVEGNVHTNAIENFWSLLKRTIKGTYVSVQPFHLFRYLDEQAFRFNNRKDDDAGRFVEALSSIVGRRLTYKLYAFSISFPNTRLAPTLVEMMPWEIQKVTPGISFLLGRDFLGQCESFTYDGTQRTYSLTTDR